jgi:Na+/H+ antiporter NhaD/arsenite permease-like protein
LDAVTGLIERASNIPPVLLGVAFIWVVAGLSAVVDNIPITIALIPVVIRLGASGIDVTPLWWALAFGAGFGGNGTIVGSTVNIIVTDFSERTRTPITPAIWNKRGMPVMLVTCAIASIMFAIFYNSF